MGQATSKRTRLYSPSFKLPPDSQSKSVLMNLPLDLLYVLEDHVDAASGLCLSLTCQAAWGFFLPRLVRRIDDDELQSFLLLLERDPSGRGTFYCFVCNKLHPFKPWFSPQSTRESLRHEKTSCSPPSTPSDGCRRKDRFNPMGNHINIAAHHVRLVMNSHLYGPAHGIPLSNLFREHVQRRGCLRIQSSTIARIIAGELFLRREYSFDVTAAGQIRTRNFRICSHVAFLQDSHVAGIPQFLWTRQAGPQPFVECSGSPGSCHVCLTDWEVSIRSGSKAWHITIQCWHQVGEGRDPDDWKWARLIEERPMGWRQGRRPNRQMDSEYLPGMVKDAWVRDERDEKMRKTMEDIMGITAMARRQRRCRPPCTIL